jgi:hypothetical protein
MIVYRSWLGGQGVFPAKAVSKCQRFLLDIKLPRSKSKSAAGSGIVIVSSKCWKEPVSANLAS